MKKNTELRKETLRRELPHLFAKKYQWQRDHEGSVNKLTFLCASNQCGKSYTNICRAIKMCTERDFQKRLWPKNWHLIDQIWYMYPDFGTVNREWDKWKSLLPNGGMKADPTYGWSMKTKDGRPDFIQFNSGMKIRFMAYSQRRKGIQATTAGAVFLDEEPTEEIYQEAASRTGAVGGYISVVFSPIVSTPFWFYCLDPEHRNTVHEKLPTAFKQVVGLSDCKEFSDGSKGMYSDESIREMINKCVDEKQVRIRIRGLPVLDSGILIHGYDSVKNIVHDVDVSGTGWTFHSGVDIGSGGKGCSYAAITMVALNQAKTLGYVINFWRGDKTKTTVMDILKQYIRMAGSKVFTTQVYDSASRDFYSAASSAGLGFSPSHKDKKSNIALINSLLKYSMLKLPVGEVNGFDGFRDKTETTKLIHEFETVREKQNKAGQSVVRGVNDGIDSLKYCLGYMPFDMQAGGEIYKSTASDGRARRRLSVEQVREQRRERYLEDLERHKASEKSNTDYDYWLAFH